MNINLELKQTADGSFTLYNRTLNEHYHSIHGAKTESKHVFINNGLAYFLSNSLSDQINILEVGFGTGLNCYYTLKHLIKNKHKINLFYHALEPFPLNEEVTKKFDAIFKDDLFSTMHRLDWNKNQLISKNLFINKSTEKIQNLNSKKKYDLVYFDAFGPRVEDKLWDLSVLKFIFHLMNGNGVFVTYCAKGQVRRDLEQIGFKVQRLPGPPGKREMLRAIKVNNDIQKQEEDLME